MHTARWVCGEYPLSIEKSNSTILLPFIAAIPRLFTEFVIAAGTSGVITHLNFNKPQKDKPDFNTTVCVTNNAGTTTHAIAYQPYSYAYSLEKPGHQQATQSWDLQDIMARIPGPIATNHDLDWIYTLTSTLAQANFNKGQNGDPIVYHPIYNAWQLTLNHLLNPLIEKCTFQIEGTSKSNYYFNGSARVNNTGIFNLLDSGQLDLPKQLQPHEEFETYIFTNRPLEI